MCSVIYSAVQQAYPTFWSTAVAKKSIHCDSTRDGLGQGSQGSKGTAPRAVPLGLGLGLKDYGECLEANLARC